MIESFFCASQPKMYFMRVVQLSELRVLLPYKNRFRFLSDKCGASRVQHNACINIAKAKPTFAEIYFQQNYHITIALQKTRNAS